MSWKLRLATGVLTASLGLGSQPARAEDPTPPPPKEEPTPPKEQPAPPKKEEPKKKDPFFGDRFAMYLETRGGPASIATFKNPVSTTSALNSVNTIDFNSNKSGQFTLGWTLPRGRGQYLLTYTGIADGNYELNAEGTQFAFVGAINDTTGGGATTFPVPWWHVSVRDGQLVTTRTPGVWVQGTDDANGNTVPDPGEIRYPGANLTVTGSVPKDLGNRVQTWDLLYRREFGGVRIRSRWTAGLRYLNYKGAIVTPSWLIGVQDNVSFGYSDGIVNHFLLMQQSTKGIGPLGSGEVDFNFFRQRLTLYGMVQVAFLVADLKADSGGFTYFARQLGPSGFYFPGNGNIQSTISKTAWNTAFEAGLRVRLLEGFHFILDWNRTGYLDTILVPTTIQFPQNATQVQLGTTALFISRDFVVSSLNIGLSFQF